MGSTLGTLRTKHIELESDTAPQYETNVGFCFKRKERKMIADEAHLVSARIPLQFRDFCAHKLLEYQTCRYEKGPLFVKCRHERHAYLDCEKDDYILRMKEFERERRLRERQLRILKKRGSKDAC